MVFKIEKLKAIVQDQSKIIDNSGNENIITRFPNNVIKYNDEMISWLDLQSLLAGSEYRLVIKEEQQELILENETTWGGVRIPGEGKTLGRSKVIDKKIPITYSMKKSTWVKYEFIMRKSKKSKNLVIEQIINLYYAQMGGK